VKEDVFSPVKIPARKVAACSVSASLARIS
jgi:hypothetical protein